MMIGYENDSESIGMYFKGEEGEGMIGKNM